MRIVEHAATGGAEQVDRRVLDMPVHPLDDRPIEIEHVHVEAKVDEAQVEERAREDPPPLALGDELGVDEVRLPERADAAPEEAARPECGALAEGEIRNEEADADDDDRVRDERRVRRVGASRAVELPARREVVAGLLQEPGDPVGDRAALLWRSAAVCLAVRGDRAIEVPVADVLLGRAAPPEPG